MTQRKQSDWLWEWSQFQNDSPKMFQEWIFPKTLEDFRGKSVLDAGCGGGQHLGYVAPYAKRVVGVDLNAAVAARANTASFANVEVRDGDIIKMDLKEQFDIVYCIGVLQHTDHPKQAIENLVRHLKPGGTLLVWVYSWEGNAINRILLEPLKRLFIRKLSKPALRLLAAFLTMLVYVPVHTVYRLPLRQLPFWQYFQAWREFSFKRNLLNVFDKLNAPQTFFFTRSQVEKWFASRQFTGIHIAHFQGVSWRASGTKPSKG